MSEVISSVKLDTVPPEILEHIAIFVGTSELKGPPTDLAALCQTSRLLYAALALQHSPSIYAAIFRNKFDTDAPMRRLGPARVTTQCLAAELRTRFTSLRRFRMGEISAVSAVDLWVAVFMSLENAGKNTTQLLDYAEVDTWLRKFLLDATGGSGIINDMEDGKWPRDTQEVSLSLWLLWLCDANGSHDESPIVRHKFSEILRAYALGAPKYPVTHQSWLAFTRIPGSPPWERVEYNHYGVTLKPTSPAISIPAILGYVTRNKPARRSMHPSSKASTADPSLSWDSDWARCVGAPDVHRPGALEGAWEGPFTYTEFSVYAAILSGAGPHLLHDGVTGQNLQVWRLREYSRYASDQVGADVLPPGDVLDAFFPITTTIQETEERVVFRHSLKDFVYTRIDATTYDETKTPRDVVVFGEGHSSWGTFKLRGRVRSSDAFVTIIKEYNGSDDRGRWLYRGYLVGGKLIGRWRDSFSPTIMNGYEGCFELDQRV